MIMKNEKELQLKRLKEFSDYCITNTGVLVSYKFNKLKQIQPFSRGKLSERDYQKVHLYLNGSRYVRYIHRLVWETYNGTIPEGYQINHKDLDKTNNHIDNLELVTLQQNIQHYWDNTIGKQKNN